MTVKTVKQREIPKLVSNVAKSTRTQFSSMVRGDHKFFFGNRALKCQPIDALRWFTETIPESSKILHIRNIMVNAVSDSETIQGSSAVVCAAALSSLLEIPDIKDTDDVSEDLRAISTLSRRASSDQILTAMSKLDGDNSFEMAKTAILGCSSNASIQVTKGSRKTTIKRTSGYKFPLIVPETFLSSSGASKEKTITDARCLIVDGFIEAISEIDGSIRASYESKTPIIIVSRGFAPDVLNTLGVNYSHGHLCAVPVVVPFDELGVNLINDIAVVVRSEIVSSTKGEIISARKWEDLGSVKTARINFSSGVMTIVDDSAKSSVITQRKHLREKRKSADSDGLRDLYDKRLACLMGEGVVVDLGEDLKDVSGVYTDRINAHIRNYRSGAKFGIVKIDDCLTRVKSNTTRRILNQLLTVSETYTTISLLIGIKNAITCARQLQQIGGIIYNDRR